MKKILFSILFVTTLTLHAIPSCQQSQNIQSFVKRFYIKVLERQPDISGLDSWTNHLISKTKTGTDVAIGFILSSEFISKEKNNEEFVHILYSAFFNRPADTGGFNTWITQLNLGTSRNEVLHSFLHSQEFINLSSSYGIQAYENAPFSSPSLEAFVRRFYEVVLERTPEATEILYWTSKLSTGESTGADIAHGFVFSEEYNEASKDNNAFINTLYQAFFNRVPDEDGLQGWMDALSNGMDRVTLLQKFLHSDEFIALANSYNILAYTGAAIQDYASKTPPTAIAGGDINTIFGKEITLDASQSSDSDGDIVCFWWNMEHEILSNSKIFIKNDFALGIYTINLTVTNKHGLTSSDAILLTVTTPTLIDTDSDGIPDITDTDDDNDGVLDVNDIFPLDPNKSEISIYDLSYKGLTFYYPNISSDNYTLQPLTDDTFNNLSSSDKLLIADKLLGTLFFGYPLNKLQEKISSGRFIQDIQEELTTELLDKDSLETQILDESLFRRSSYNEQVAVDIFTRFFLMDKLDSYFMQNWVAYILTQTIMFSPAYELESTHTPNIARVYNRLVSMIKEESGMRYITYVHMMSEDNWRRFRSPEDNGREMLEIFTLDMNDSHVPIAGQALKNWKLDRDSDTLVVSLNQNREALQLFNTTVYNGDDFYRELAKSSSFTTGATRRIVDFFFPNATQDKKSQITNTIASSSPEKWQDILLQIIFSEEYLLHSSRAKSAEELFFSLSKKLDFKHQRSTLHYFKSSLEDMHQASMKYKLGKLNRVPLDTLSFANYHKFIREQILLRKSRPDKITEYNSWHRQGWSESFVANTNYTLNEEDAIESLESFIHYLFNATIYRSANDEEMDLFKEHMLRDKSDTNSTKILDYTFNLLHTRNDAQEQSSRRESHKQNIAFIVLDYISRLSETYTHKEVK